jgi:CheY-like chemotaxis protein
MSAIELIKASLDPNLLSIQGEIMAFPSILCVGEDPELLKTRAMLLQRLNAEVKWTTSIREALEYLSNENFDLIVLCHSLKESDTTGISNAVRMRQPPPNVLSISKSFGFNDERAQILCDAIVDSNPASLIDCARALLLKRSFPHSELRFDNSSKFAGHH